MEKLELFEKISNFRVASYPLQDMKIFSDDFIVSVEENVLMKHRFSFDEYQEWLRGDGESLPQLDSHLEGEMA
jgi:hypothetical protein|tara:strand:+ start:589 stop:807 length:219 start_codon:yes stop_codon:yes gene_type:complete